MTVQDLSPASNSCQRWHGRKQSWRHRQPRPELADRLHQVRADIRNTLAGHQPASTQEGAPA